MFTQRPAQYFAAQHQIRDKLAPIVQMVAEFNQ